MTITLTPEIEQILTVRAAQQGTTPELLTLRDLSALYNGKLLFPLIQENTEGAALVAGTRIKVAQIALEHTREGLTPEQIAEQHPHLTSAQVSEALAYYYSHREAVEAQIAASLAYADQARREAKPSPLAARLRAEGRLPSEILSSEDLAA